MHHTSVYAERQHKPAENLDEAIRRLHDSVERRERDLLEKRYPFNGTGRTKQITNRIVGDHE